MAHNWILKLILCLLGSLHILELSPRPSTPTHSAGKKTPLEKRIAKKNEKGETLLHIAAIRGDARQCRKLITAGADVNVRDNAGA